MITLARRSAFAVVRRAFERGAYADLAFRAEAERLALDKRERAFAMQLAYGTIQRKATLDYLIERLSSRPPADLDAPTLAALRLGLYQIVFLGGVAEHAAVAESVELAKAGRGGGHRLVNAVLRRATREAAPLLAEIGDSTPARAALLHSHPRWLAELWWETLGRDDALALMAADNRSAESAVRANTLRTTREELLEALAAEGVGAHAGGLAAEAVVLDQAWDVHGSRLYAEGALTPQSRASMLVAHVVAPRPGERVLDLCAAPGGKTTHIAALMRDEGEVVAVDLDPRRGRALSENARRLGARSVEVVTGDASKPEFGNGFDRVLVDPPCSDLGTLQARPDARWRKGPEAIGELAALQRRILEAASEALEPGGRLVYSTCTISPAENERQLRGFLAKCEDFAIVDLSVPYPEASSGGGPFLQTFPHRHGTDGFFLAALDKRGQP